MNKKIPFKWIVDNVRYQASTPDTSAQEYDIMELAIYTFMEQLTVLGLIDTECLDMDYGYESKGLVKHDSAGK